MVLSLGANCVDNNINRRDSGDDKDEGPEIELLPESTELGPLRDGESELATFTIRNAGNAPLSLLAVTIEGDDSFELDLSGIDTELAEGEETQVFVTFTARLPEHEARLVVNSNDADTPRATAEITGLGLIPQLTITPNPYDFGKVEPQCFREQPISLVNTGTDTLVIDSVVGSGEAFAFGELTLPVSLAPGEYVDVPVTFQPLDFISYESQLWVTGNVPTQSAQQIGLGADGGDYSQEWVQPEQGKVDIMFWMDTSCSMDDDRARLVDNFAKFINELEEVDADYLLMAATADTGCHNIAYIEPDTENKSEIFEKALSQEAPGGAYSEAGLTVVKNGLSASALAGCNKGFGREGSQTSVVLVADEIEQSPSANTTAEVVGSILAERASTRISAVAGDIPDGCETAEPGFGYYEATQMTGGLFLSICQEDWGPMLTSLAENALIVTLADTFYLKHEPEVPTLQVLVDEVEVTTGWTYDATINAVVFDAESIPGEGQRITVNYSTAQTCD